MVKHKKPAPEYTTEFSGAYRYLEERRTGQLSRVEVKFPLVTDRRAAGNIPYASDELRREWRGQVPTVGRPNDAKSIKGALSLDEAQFIYVNDAPNVINIPNNHIATTSGHEPLVDDPFTEGEQQGYATDNPTEVNYEFENVSTSGEFFIGMNIDTENMRGGRYPYRAVQANQAYKDIKFGWVTSPDFDNPTEPAVRYPKNGAKRNKKSTI